MLASRVRMGVSKDNGLILSELILYDYGIENVPFVGWDINGDAFPNYTDYEVSKYSNHLYLYSDNWDAPPPPKVGFSTSNKIDLTPYTTLKVNWEKGNKVWRSRISFGISNIQKPASETNYTKIFTEDYRNNVGFYEEVIDLSNTVGQYYIVISNVGLWTDTKIHSISLE